MINVVEVSADVGLENVPHLLGHDLLAQRPQRMMRVTPRPKSIRAVQEIRFEHRFEDARHRPLNQSVLDRRNPNGRVPTFPALSVSPPAAPVAPDRCRLSAVRRYPGLAVPARSRTPRTSPRPFRLPPRRFICRQVSLRNSGVSRCASEVKRSLRSNFAFRRYLFQLCGHPLLLPRACRRCFPGPASRSAPPLPHVRGFPALRVLPAGPTSTHGVCLPMDGPFSRHTRPITPDQDHAWISQVP